MPMDWRQNVKAAMKKRGMNMAQLSLAVTDGKNKTYVSSLLSGRKHSPSIDLFAQMAKVLGVSMGTLYYGSELDETDDAILSIFLQLDPDQRRTVLKMVASLAPDQEPKSEE